MHVKSLHEKAAALLMGVSLVLGGLWGCGSGNSSPASPLDALPPAVAAAARSATPVNGGLVAANNTFGFQLFRELRKTDAGKNVFISPTSLSLALEIAYNGAQGQTQTAMAQTLGLQGMSLADLNNGNAALQASLFNPDPQVTLTIANSLWFHKDKGQVLPTFVQTNTAYYGSEIGDLAGAPDNINAWASGATHGKITQIVTPADIADPNLIAIIANAVYFKGQWTTKFDATLTTDSTFTLADGSSFPDRLMNQTGTFDYFQGDHFQAIRLPYGQKRIGMVILLPAADTSLSSFLTGLTLQNWNAWIPQFTPRLVSLGLPRFTSKYKTDLIAPLTTLGMGIAFIHGQADFSALSPASQIALTKATHQSFVAVDEEGTEAAAVTTIGAGAGGMPEPTMMTVNRPFVCAIYDTKTGVILFLGAIDQPTS